MRAMICFKPRLNELLSRLDVNLDTKEKYVQQLIDDSLLLDPETPFVSIDNFEEALNSLSISPIWLSYGGARTGSTTTSLILRILMDSLVSNYISAWEGDFKDPLKFIDLVLGGQQIKSGILKIHRFNDDCNTILEKGMAKGFVPIRDYPSKVSSYKRMSMVRNSPFYRERGLSHDEIKNFIISEVKLERRKRSLHGCLFFKIREIEKDPAVCIQKIALHSGIKLSQSNCKFISKFIAKDKLREDSRIISPSSTGHDSQTFMHFEHIASEGYDDAEIKEFTRNFLRGEIDSEGYLLN